MPSPNFSASRKETKLLVIHTAEGAVNFTQLGNYFARYSVQASSHVGIDDTDNTIGEYVKAENKSWTAFAANDLGLHAELCGFARWERVEWLQHPVMLRNTAKWLNEESLRWGIPLVKLTASDIVNGMEGVCGHKDLVEAGFWGNHWDPGPNFPWDAVLASAPPPSPAPPVAPKIPDFPGRYLKLTSPMMHGADISTWQQQMRNRGWPIRVDGWYGPASESICYQFQREKELDVDGIVGPLTWAAAWLAPVT